MAGVQGPVALTDYFAIPLEPNNTSKAVAQRPDYSPAK